MILGHAIYIYRYFHKNLDILIKYEYNRVKFLLILIYQTKHTKNSEVISACLKHHLPRYFGIIRPKKVSISEMKSSKIYKEFALHSKFFFDRIIKI